MNLVWQVLALSLATFLAGRALDWPGERRLLVLALLFASWDVLGWAMAGLIAAGWLLPTALALWGFRRGSALWSGIDIAWAGLIELFPFALLIPLFVRMCRGLVFGRRGSAAARAFGVCAAATLVLLGISAPTQRSWVEFRTWTLGSTTTSSLRSFLCRRSCSGAAKWARSPC